MYSAKNGRLKSSSPPVSSPIASGAWATTSSAGSDGIPLRGACRQRAAPRGRGLLREVEDWFPALGQLGGEFYVLRPERRHHDRDPFPDRVIDQLERLAQAGALISWQRDGVVPALMHQPLAPPDAAADFDDLPGAPDRRVVRHPMPALDHLRARGPDAQHEPAPGHVVQAGRRHRGEGRRPGIELQDARGDLHPLGLRGEVAELADRIEAVSLGHEDDVEAGLLVIGQLGDGLGEVARVIQCHPDAHTCRAFPKVDAAPAVCRGSRHPNPLRVWLSTLVRGRAAAPGRRGTDRRRTRCGSCLARGNRGWPGSAR